MDVKPKRTLPTTSMCTQAGLLSIALPALAFAAALGGSVSEAHAAPFLVTAAGDAPDASPGDGNCATAGGPCSLRAAVMEANALSGADTITVSAAISSISLSTLGAGTNTADTGDLDITETLTIVGNRVVIDGLNDDRIFQIHPGVTANISGVDLVNGSGGFSGGAIYSQGDLTLSNCTLYDNAASDYGGGIASLGSLTVTNCVLQQNEADRGGAIYATSTTEIDDSSISYNDAYSYGGGLYFIGAAVVDVTDTSIFANHAGERGGGVATFSEVNFTRGDVYLNDADIAGGGLYMYGEDAVVDAFKTDFISNVSGDGAGIYNVLGDLTLRRVGVMFNSATGGDGGGINNQGAFLAHRSAIHDNLADMGAGIYNNGINADLTLRNATLSGNIGTGSGGGLYVGSTSVAWLNNVTITNNTGTSGGLQGGGATTMSNTILGGNATPGGAASDCVGSLTSDGHNLVQHTASCTISGPATGDVYGVAPGLDPLANNGGATQTHAVQAGSAARNAGDNATCESVDQRGASRPLGGTCDIGAFERN